MTKKHLSLAVLAGLLLAGCEEDPQAFWTAEQCNERLAQDVTDFEEYQSDYARDKKMMEDQARRGNTSAAEANRKGMESRKEATKSLLTFIDTNISKYCKKEVWRADLVAKIDAARAFAADSGAPSSVVAEGMPALRVTSIKQTFVPYQMDQFGRCEGPFLDLVFTITNNGADFPRPVDLEQYAGLAKRPAADLEFFNVTGEFDFGNQMKERLNFVIKGDKGTIPSGGTIDIPASLKIAHNQTSAKVNGTVSMYAYLKSGEVAPYETEFEIPTWDIYVFSHQALGGKDPDTGKYYIGTIGTVTNLGTSPTPGPLQASFVLQDTETGRHISSWTGTTEGPVSGNTQLFAKTPSDVLLPKHVKVQASVIPLCPDGSHGNLADGNATNNSRELREVGAAAASAAASQ